MSSTLTAEDVSPNRAAARTATMNGLVCLVTGATSGIGEATALQFAGMGATVAVVARTEERGRATVDQIAAATGNEDVHLFVADLSSQAAVRAASDGFARRFDRLNVLVNAAGVFVRERVRTKDGFELMFSTNQLAPFLLTLTLLPGLKTASPSRIINITAPATTRPDFLDLQGERRFRPATAFGASKAANLLFTFALARRLAGSGVTVNAFHPGIVRTKLMRNATLPLRLISSSLNALRGRSPDDAAKWIVDLAISPRFETTNGMLIHDGRVIPSPFQDDVDAQEQLFRACEDLTGAHFSDK